MIGKRLMDRIWTKEDRLKQAEVAKNHKIWKHSTGPKTKHGKARSSQNALKHGFRSIQWRALKKVLKDHQRKLNKAVCLIKESKCKTPS